MKYIRIIFVLSIVGCSTVNTKSEYKELSLNDQCCNSFKDFFYEEMSEEKTSFKLRKTSDVYDFGEGNSYFKAFALGGVKSLSLKSYYIGFGISASVVFKPVIVELNENYEKIKVVDKSLPNSCASSRGCFLTGEYIVDPGAKYIVIFTSPTFEGKTHNHVHTYSSEYSAGGILYSPGRNDRVARYEIPFSPIGDIEIIAN